MTQGFDDIEIINCTWKPHSDDYYHGYDAGAASRQEEIDLLEKEIIGTQKFLNNQNCIKQAKIDELQKRIDDALDYVFGLYCTGDLDTERLENILKGESNE